MLWQWLCKPWLFTSQIHQQPWRCSSETKGLDSCLSDWGVQVSAPYRCQKWYKVQIYFTCFLKLIQRKKGWFNHRQLPWYIEKKIIQNGFTHTPFGMQPLSTLSISWLLTFVCLDVYWSLSIGLFIKCESTYLTGQDGNNGFHPMCYAF